MADITELGSFFAPPPPKAPVDLADRFLSHISTWLTETYPSFQSDREPGLHASSLWKTCARQRVLVAALQLGDDALKEKLAAGNYLTFDVGHALHHWWQNNYLGPMGVLIGDWFCSKCTEVTASGPQPTSCPKCNQDRRSVLTYQEYRIADPEMGYVGHCDGLLQLGNVKVVFEFKTASPTEFEKITQPKMQHVVQSHAYMNALGLEDTLVVYQNKGSQCDWSKNQDGWSAGKLKLRVFHVKFDKSYWATYVGRCREYKRAGELIRRLPVVRSNDAMDFEGLCAHKKSPLADSCPVVTACFALGSTE